MLIRQSMLESQKFEKLQAILSQSSALQDILNLITSIVSKHNDFHSQSFVSSAHFNFLVQQINKLEMPEVNSVLEEIASPHCIVALPIKRVEKFTLFFVIVPKGLKFDWHSHPKMSGISKCIHGHLQISTIDFRYLNKISLKQFNYPRSCLKIQNLKYDKPKNVSIIQPHGFNYHKIEALQLSAFFDLLLPDYPENTCNFFTTQAENQDHLVIRQIFQPTEHIEGWDIYLKQLEYRQKHIIKNFILK